MHAAQLSKTDRNITSTLPCAHVHVISVLSLSPNHFPRFLLPSYQSLAITIFMHHYVQNDVTVAIVTIIQGNHDTFGVNHLFFLYSNFSIILESLQRNIIKVWDCVNSIPRTHDVRHESHSATGNKLPFLSMVRNILQYTAGHVMCLKTDQNLHPTPRFKHWEDSFQYLFLQRDPKPETRESLCLTGTFPLGSR